MIKNAVKEKLLEMLKQEQNNLRQLHNQDITILQNTPNKKEYDYRTGHIDGIDEGLLLIDRLMQFAKSI